MIGGVRPMVAVPLPFFISGGLGPTWPEVRRDKIY